MRPLILALLPLLAAANVVLHHRVVDPGLPALPFLEFGNVSLEEPRVPSISQDDVETFIDLLKTETEPDLSVAYYHIGLAIESKPTQADWAFSTAKICHLQTANSQTLVVHLSSDEKPYALDYFLSPINPDGSCPTPSLTPAEVIPRFKHLNSTVIFRRPSSPPLPQLRAPPQLTPEGEVVKPVPEKTFLQKYWLYMAALLVLLLFGGGAPEEEGPSRGGGGGGGGR